MKAMMVVSFGVPEGLQSREVPVPAPGPGQVLIRVQYAGINFADVNARRGRYPHRVPPIPFIPGLEVAGTVEILGDRVTGLSAGQRVAAFVERGGYAELALASAQMVIPLPDDVDWQQAAAFPTISFTAFHLLTTAGHLRKGETVLIQAAAGGVGTVLVQMARLLGAERVLGTAGSPDKVRYAEGFGANRVVNYCAEDLAESVREATDGHGVDLVLDAVGGSARTKSLDVLAPLGRLVMYGNASAEPEIQLSTTDLRERVITVSGFNLSIMRRTYPERALECAEMLLGWMRVRKLRIDVTRVFPLAEAAEAHRHMESRASRGKLLLQAADD